MRTRTYVALRIVLGVALAVGAVSEAGAFYPEGYFHPDTGELMHPRWPLGYMDVDGDGDVSGVNEGLLVNFESGLLGFTEEEKAKVIAGFETWEAVPSSYMAFRYGQDIPDPVEIGTGFDEIDLINIVALELPEDEIQVIGDGTLAIVLETYVMTDMIFEVNGVGVPVTGGQFVDVDAVISGEGVRFLESLLGFGTQGAAVIMGGLMSGLSYSPFENFDDAASVALGENIEKRVVALRDGTGQLRQVGVTPSMLNALSFYDEGNGILSDSKEDLAPDDIAGITYLYPRTNQDLFFSVSDEARTQTRDGFPSAPLSGSHIMAWCDTDNNPLSSPVPFIDTLAGLYSCGDAARGQFVLINLFKQLESSLGQTFAARYVLTSSEFEPFVLEQADYDTTHGCPASADAMTFSSLFPSEVFNEYGNINGVTNVAQGSPLYYNSTTRKVESATTGKDLNTMLAAGRPMFGDPNLVCPLNVVVAGLKTNAGPSTLRGVRDSVLLNSAVGVALMDAYYRVAPAAAEFLLSHGRVLAVARLVARGAEWVLTHRLAVLIALGVALAVSLARRRSKRTRGAITSLLVVAVLLAVAGRADATVIFKAMEEYVGASEDIVTGTVTAADSHWTADGKRIVTDVTIEVGDVVKGRLNKAGKVHLTLPVGQVGGVVRRCAQLPTFKPNEEVLVFLQNKKGAETPLLVGGITGKYSIKTDEETGEKTVCAKTRETKILLGRAAAKLEGGQSEDGAGTEKRPNTVALDDFTDYLRDIDKAQQRAKK